MSYVSHDGLAYFKHKLDQKFISNITSEDGALKIVLGDGTVLKSIQDTTVTQKKSTANELYPLLLCYDAMADQDQLSKETWFGQHILANPYYGYLASRGMYVKHPTFNRRNGVSQKVEWAYDFTDAVSGLGNPMSQVYAYVDPASEGGEHCIELRLYGNPNVSPTVPSINDSTNTFSIGVGVTGGNVQFGYCPSTPLYLDDGSTLRTEATGHGNDIITRDWLNLNGSFTGLVHTTMNETIDGAKTFKKTVTINSGDNNNKAGLYVQGNSDVHGNEHVYGTETVDGKLTANGTAEIKGGSGNNPSLLVTGNETVTGKLIGTGTAEFSGGSGNTPTLTVNGNESISGNSSIGGNSFVTGNETVSGKITGNNGAEISGGNGLVVNGNETVNGEIYKVVNNTPQEYVSYVTNKQETKTTIVNNLIKDKGGLAVDNNKNIYVNTGKGLNLDNVGKINVDFSQLPAQDVTNIITGMVAPGSGLVADSNTGKLAVDFNQMPTDKFETLLKSLKMLIPLSSNLDLYVATNGVNDKSEGRGLSANKPFATIQYATEYVSSTYNLGNYNVTIYVADGNYGTTGINLPNYSVANGHIYIKSTSQDPSKVRTGFFNLDNPCSYTITDITATHADGTNGTRGCFTAINGGYLNLINVVADLSDVNQNNMALYGFYTKTNGYIQIWAIPNVNHPSGATFKANANSVISGCFRAEDHGLIEFAADIRVEGSFNMTGAFAEVTRFGILNPSLSVYPNPGRTPQIPVTGTVTGIRYRASALSFINSRGNSQEAAAVYYPGSTDGTVSAGAQYTYASVTV